VRSLRRHLALVGLVAGSAACFQPDVPVGPSALPGVRLVSVQVEYRQPANCRNSTGTCNARVVFFGSWMNVGDNTTPGGPVLLDTPAGPNFWTGVVTNVPVNWPPTDVPHYVRVYDPHLQATSTGGVTAARLTVGGQVITQYDSPGTPTESGLVYIDDNGVGHNPL
jgi:hypothetical protein